MMKKIFFILFLFCCFSAKAQWNPNDTSKYTHYKYWFGLRIPRVQPDSVLGTPIDTIFSKNGLATIGTKLFVGNGSYWTEKGSGGGGSGSSRVNILAYPLRSDSISPDTSRIYIRQSWQDSALAGISLYNTFLVSTGDIILDTATSQVTVMDNIIFYENGIRDSITSPFSKIIPSAGTGMYQTTYFFIDNTGSADTVRGPISDDVNVHPALPSGGILFAIATTFEDSVISATTVNTYQRTAIMYIDPGTGQPITDSLNNSYDNITKSITVSGAFISNILGDVAFKLKGGSSVRAYESASNGRLYLDGAASNTSSYVIQRTGASFQNNNTLMPSGNFIVGWDGIPASEVSSAKFAIISNSKGFLPPKLTGSEQAGITGPVSGLMIYNTDSSALCYYNGSAWVKIGGSGGSSGSSWELTGNAGTDSTVNFIGTTDLQPLYVKVNDDTTAKFGTLYNFQAGKDTWAGGYASAAFGEGNLATGNKSFATGFGNTASGFSSTAMGISAIASGENSISIGNSSMADNVNSTAIGSNAFSDGEDATAIGFGAQARAENSMAVGYSASSNAVGATAIGYGANATVENSTAIGSGVTVKTDTTIINNITRFAGNALAGTGKVPTAIDAYGNWTWQTPSGGGTITDSLKIGGDWFFTKKITLTPTDINSLNSSPVLAVAAPGAGKAIDVISSNTRMVFNTTAYSNTEAIEMYYDGGSQAILHVIGDIGVGADYFKKNTIISDAEEYTFKENAALYILATGDNADGDSDVNIYIYYRVITL